MTNKTAWTGGNLNSGIGWAPLFSSSASTDINQGSGLTNAYSVLSTLTLTNGGYLDQFMDISLRVAISSNTMAQPNTPSGTDDLDRSSAALASIHEHIPLRQTS